MITENKYDDFIINPQEESGIFGVYSNDENLDLCKETLAALFALQHRGQNSCGIAINDNGEFKCHKDVGTIAEVMRSEDIKSLGNGKIAVGHVCYTTAEMTNRALAQPLLMRYVKGSLALSHNGSITNFAQLHKSLEQGGAIFQSNSNAELIAYVIASKRVRTLTIEEAVLSATKDIEGAYSLVISSPSKLIGVRDENGFRPLCIGKLGDSYMLSSESCAFDSLGAEFIRDVLPGEVVSIDEKGITSYMMERKSDKTSVCMFEYVYVARPDSIIDGLSVSMARRKIGEYLAVQYPMEADIVCGVPDSGLSAALGYSIKSGIPFEMAILKNKYIRRTTTTIEQDEKEKLLQVKLNVLKIAVKDKKVIVIDDSIVKGETAKHIVSLLKDAGAKEVHMIISSPVITNSCHFGVDIKNDGTLISKNLTVEGIRKEIGADSLGFLSLDNFRELAKDINIGYCDACFSNEYKATIPTEQYVDKFSKKIIKK